MCNEGNPTFQLRHSCRNRPRTQMSSHCQSGWEHQVTGECCLHCCVQLVGYSLQYPRFPTCWLKQNSRMCTIHCVQEGGVAAHIPNRGSKKLLSKYLQDSSSLLELEQLASGGEATLLSMLSRGRISANSISRPLRLLAKLAWPARCRSMHSLEQ